ncbi:hypothetical protein N7448_004697 [Penicillium atrosanguineum]|uniref:Histone chaperone domain-containing protein n=1 Tax=Penicillium atrosanguineum TaxID=1132637 RepID=A0A9W9PRR9_9EURO|nr:uncharacterized protein N7443_008446 [Penicillium atrosanguineum]KAJ5125375.1 hypothetical protein N7526_007552 [Penicillium atrosanguineum]KAJ5136143.1 hypothetical protein N7448_004697 [Penicillium atrosanguineum]KAJ5292493.1 hypothetical protein N7443_008446 [Penicillium atrosanguineum]KAJ5303484.1 hypothetical protein N7476_010283 [Penicillium atrosanguineum]
MSNSAERQPEVVDDDFEDPDLDNNNMADSDEQLAYDDNDAIDKSNITTQGLRHAKPQSSTGYSEPGEDDLPEGA